MAGQTQLQYQSITGPVWREPVASRLAWLPRGEWARPLERRSPSELVFPIQFGVPAYNPRTLEWIPSGQPVGRSLPYISRPPYSAATVSLDSALLSWQPVQTGNGGQSASRSILDATVSPIQFTTPAFDPQHLEWIPQGPAPRTLLELRKLGDFVQPAFDALYKPEGLQWLFEGQLSVRGIPYALQSVWTIDPSPVVVVAFDPQFFPFQATDILLARSLQSALQSDFATPPLPPGPDVILPPADTGLGGSSATHPRRVVYERGTKRKPKTFIDRIGETYVELEKTAEPVPDAESAGALPVDTAPVRAALAARLPAPLPPTVSTPLVVRPLPDDDEDDDLLLLS